MAIRTRGLILEDLKRVKRMEKILYAKLPWLKEYVEDGVTLRKFTPKERRALRYK